MKKDNIVPVNEFCTSHNISISFISTIREKGLLEVNTFEETMFINASQLQHLEKIIRLYYDLEINLEGIETINHLLSRLIDMQDEITKLKNRLRLYEEG